MEAGQAADLEALKAIVQAVEPPTRFEHLAAALIGDLIGTAVAVAKSGFQYGADAGTVGRQQRFLRVECKRYKDRTEFDDRQLLGEIDQALTADPALEAWILAATREVDEQLERQLFEKGERSGVPVLVIDWKSHAPALAALLVSNPQIVSHFLDPAAGTLAARLQPQLTSAIEHLRRDLAAWQIGATALRRLAIARLREVWTDPRQSQAHFGQVVSGGAKRHIHRAQLLRQLDEWWSNQPKPASPACVTGLFGVGKTWAVVDWLIERAEQLPAPLLIPASAVAGQNLGSVSDVLSFLAQRLYEVSRVRDASHWRLRLERLLRRPEAEGPVLLIVLDGMNQQPQVPWESLLKVLQGADFVGRVRVITTTRTLHFEVRLRRLRALIDRAVPIEVDGYDARPGGELDQMLALHGLQRSDLHADLHALAQNPRLFELVIRFRDRLVDARAATPHRLLWEYGSDTAGASVDKVFSAQEWADWLGAAARKIQEGIRSYSLKDLGEMTARPDLEPSEVYQRVSELADSAFFNKLADGTLALSPALVAHAMGATAVHLLSAMPDASREALESALEQWLDPISGLDQRDEILRAAVSIALESGPPRPLLGVLTAAWLQTQNLPETHRAEVRVLAAEMPEALLDAIELSHRYTHVASRHAAVDALRGVDRGDDTVRSRIFARAAAWLRRVSRDIEVLGKTEPDVEQHRRKRLLERIGRDESGPCSVLGEAMVLVDRDEDSWTDHLPALIENYPLLDAVPALRIAAVASAIGFSHRAWDQLQWVFFLNPIDPDAVAARLREAADAMRLRQPEPGVHTQLGLRAAELLLHVSGAREDDEAAGALHVTLGRPFRYQTDYLADPGRSVFFRLERRHASAVLVDQGLPLRVRIQRCGDLWLDPGFQPPVAFNEELAHTAHDFPVENMYVGRYATRESIDFDELQPAMARCAPQALAALRRKLARATPSTVAARAARAWHQNDALLLHGPEEVASAHALRAALRDTREGEEMHAASELLQTELTGLDALAQVVLVVEADLSGIPLTVTDHLRPLSTEQVDQLVERYRFGSPKQQRDVVVLLVTQPPVLSPSAWNWLLDKTRASDEVDVRLALMALAAADATRLGAHLDQAGWRFSAELDTFAAHAASGALLHATRGQPFEPIAVRLAPWRLLEAVRVRGEDPAEARIAIEQLDAILTGGPAEAPDPGAQLSIERGPNSAQPYRYSVQPMPPDDPNSAQALQEAFDEEAQRKAQSRARETANARIEQARKQGASLYLEFVSREDGLAILRHAPDVVARWFTGHDTLSADFVRRVQLAEGLFVAVCEALLTEDPARGVAVWTALQKTVRTRITGAADLPEWLHLIFRAPASAPVLAARDQWLELATTHTDAGLFELALAAQLNGGEAWLESVIARDLASDLPWRQQRALVMRGFTAGNVLPVDGAWTEGPSGSWTQQVVRGAARLQFFEACAHHWWREYWRCEDREEAYAAWVLFTQCVDRRALAWMHREAADAAGPEAVRAAKQRHWDVARVRFKHGADKSNLSLQRRYLSRSIDEMVWPWRE